MQGHVFKLILSIASGDGDNSCRAFSAFGGAAETPSEGDRFEICPRFTVLQIFRAAGTGDALSSNRKDLLTERGHDQPTVKRPKENRRVFQLLNAGRFSEPPRFFASIMPDIAPPLTHRRANGSEEMTFPVITPHDFRCFTALASRICRHCSIRSPMIFSYPRSVGR